MSARLVIIGFTRGKSHPCIFWHQEKQIKTLVHGDDYVSSGTVEAMNWLEAEVEKAYEMKTQKLVNADGYKVEGKVFNRVIRRTGGGWEMKADPRHAELVVEKSGLRDDKGIDTPGCLVPMRMTLRKAL